jgi:hypothetical protein
MCQVEQHAHVLEDKPCAHRLCQPSIDAYLRLNAPGGATGGQVEACAAGEALRGFSTRRVDPDVSWRKATQEIRVKGQLPERTLRDWL